MFHPFPQSGLLLIIYHQLFTKTFTKNHFIKSYSSLQQVIYIYELLTRFSLVLFPMFMVWLSS